MDQLRALKVVTHVIDDGSSAAAARMLDLAPAVVTASTTEARNDGRVVRPDDPGRVVAVQRHPLGLHAAAQIRAGPHPGVPRFFARNLGGEDRDPWLAAAGCETV